MKIKNLADYPQQLGDGRVIGASGTKQDTREYDLEALAKEDKKRVKDGTLAVVEEIEPGTLEPENSKTEKTVGASSGGEQLIVDSGEEKIPLENTGIKDEGTKAKQNGGRK